MRRQNVLTNRGLGKGREASRESAGDAESKPDELLGLALAERTLGLPSISTGAKVEADIGKIDSRPRIPLTPLCKSRTLLPKLQQNSRLLQKKLQPQ
jgi:hypothetical protein